MKKIDNCENSTVLVALLLAGILMVMGAYRIFSYLCENAQMNAVTFLLGGAAIRGITGSTDEVIISNALLYLKISAPVIPPMAVLVILRNMLQGIRHTVEPLLASGLELVGKVIFAVWLVPVRGYRAVCFCEPTTWVVCFVFILLAVWRCRGDLRDAEKI